MSNGDENGSMGRTNPQFCYLKNIMYGNSYDIHMISIFFDYFPISEVQNMRQL